MQHPVEKRWNEDDDAEGMIKEIETGEKKKLKEERIRNKVVSDRNIVQIERSISNQVRRITVDREPFKKKQLNYSIRQVLGSVFGRSMDVHTG